MIFKNWIAKRKLEKARTEKIANNEYLSRLRNSAKGYRGHSHYGDGPFLEVVEVESILRKELKRLTDGEQSKESE